MGHVLQCKKSRKQNTDRKLNADNIRGVEIKDTRGMQIAARQPADVVCCAFEDRPPLTNLPSQGNMTGRRLHPLEFLI